MLEFTQDEGSRTHEIEELSDLASACERDYVDEMDGQDFCDALLGSLVTMASKSKRRQADLSAALRRAEITATADQVRDAMARLLSDGCIRELVPLYDGGMLMTVTNMGMDRTSRNPHWRFLERLTSPAA